MGVHRGTEQTETAAAADKPAGRHSSFYQTHTFPTPDPGGRNRLVFFGERSRSGTENMMKQRKGLDTRSTWLLGTCILSGVTKAVWKMWGFLALCGVEEREGGWGWGWVGALGSMRE